MLHSYVCKKAKFDPPTHDNCSSAHDPGIWEKKQIYIHIDPDKEILLA